MCAHERFQVKCERVRCWNSILILAHLTIWHYDKQLIISKEKQQTKKANTINVNTGKLGHYPKFSLVLKYDAKWLMSPRNNTILNS